MTPQEKRAHEYAEKASLCPGEVDARFEGYLQAEKDLALTGEDMRLAFKAVNDALDNCEGKTRAEVLEDALQRFNEQREKK